MPPPPLDWTKDVCPGGVCSGGRPQAPGRLAVKVRWLVTKQLRQICSGKSRLPSRPAPVCRPLHGAAEHSPISEGRPHRREGQEPSLASGYPGDNCQDPGVPGDGAALQADEPTEARSSEVAAGSTQPAATTKENKQDGCWIHGRCVRKHHTAVGKVSSSPVLSLDLSSRAVKQLVQDA